MRLVSSCALLVVGLLLGLSVPVVEGDTLQKDQYCFTAVGSKLCGGAGDMICGEVEKQTGLCRGALPTQQYKCFYCDSGNLPERWCGVWEKQTCTETGGDPNDGGCKNAKKFQGECEKPQTSNSCVCGKNPVYTGVLCNAGDVLCKSP